MRIFYSWQSDLPNKTNRGFIEDALERAAKSIRSDDSLTVEPVIDRDTVGVPGAPNIAATILEKIERAEIFVADVSIINQESGARATPNPNVLVELGYALKCKGYRAVLLVQNTAYGGPELLPFDLKMSRVISYTLANGQLDKADTRKALSSQIETALRLIISDMEQIPSGKEVAVGEDVLRLLSNPHDRIELDGVVGTLANRVVQQIEQSGLTNITVYPSTDELDKRIRYVDEVLHELVTVVMIGAQWAKGEQIRPFRRALERIAAIAKQPNGSFYEQWRSFQYYPALRLFYASVMAALCSDNIEFLREIAVRLQLMDIHDREKKSAVELLHVQAIFASTPNPLGNFLPGKAQHYTPGSDYLHETLRKCFVDLLPGDDAFTEQFDRCEYLISLLYAKIRIAGDSSRFWTPVGSYIWRRSHRQRDLIQQEIEREGSEWPLITGGLFTSLDEVIRLVDEVEQYLDRSRGARGIV